MKKIFLDAFPKWETGANKGNFQWEKSIGYKVKFIYNDIEGWIEIIGYNLKNHNLEIKYNNVHYYIHTDSFQRCRLGRIIGEITKEFKIEIGQRLVDNKRDITINDRNKIGKWKYYKYKCNLCGFDCGEHYSAREDKYENEYWITEGSLLRGSKCSCCGNKAIVIGINDIPTTTPWLISYFQGGYEEAKKYNCGSNKKIYPVCRDCGKIKDKRLVINDIFRRHSIGCTCSDFISYGEKYMYNILEQLGVNFQTQLSKTTFKWCNKYRYDFYFKYNGEQYICEVNGSQHYEDAWDKLEKTQENDRLKKELALSNGIKEENYIVIDCRKSELEWIRDNKDGILNSRLTELFDSSKIDWLKAEEFTCSNFVKIVCDYKRNNPEMTTKNIGEIVSLCEDTIRKWLKKGNKLGWCDYDIKLENYKGSQKAGKLNGKTIGVFKNNLLIYISENAHELDRQSYNLFGIKIDYRNVSAVCLGKEKSHKGFTYKYIKDLTAEEYIKYDIENKLKELHNRELGQAS